MKKYALRFSSFFALVLLLFPLLASCKGENGFSVPENGAFFVTEEKLGAAFSAYINGESARFVFSLPRTVEGLTAETADGVSYKLTYGGISFEAGSFAVEAASDLTAALFLLRERGKKQNNSIEAAADKIYARGKIRNGVISEIEFFNGAKKRNYKLQTEDEVWRRGQRQE